MSDAIQIGVQTEFRDGGRVITDTQFFSYNSHFLTLSGAMQRKMLMETHKYLNTKGELVAFLLPVTTWKRVPMNPEKKAKKVNRKDKP